MKIWIALLLLAFLIISLVSYLIPTKINVHQTITIPVNTRAFTRKFLDVENWQWWPGARNNQNSLPQFSYNGNTYTVIEKKMTSIVIEVANGKDSTITQLVFIPVMSDTVQLNWLVVKQTGRNPFSRLQKSSWITRVKEDLSTILGRIRSFYSNEDNIYGLHIIITQVSDSNFIFTSSQSKDYPSTNQVYKLVDNLKKYIQANKARPMGYPMLNVFKANDTAFVTKVALPVDIELKDSGNIRYRWMLKGGNILVGEVHGGPSKIDKAFLEMQNYLQDHQRNSPAIPYQSLITDRRLEVDTNRWVTKLYWPVM